jgi:hypothetical protein
MDAPGMFKVVILDEVDGVSDQFFKALRAWRHSLVTPGL